MTLPRFPATATPEPVRAALGTGLRFLWRERPLRWATAAAAFTNFAFAPLAAVMTLYAEDELGISDEAALGIFFAVFSAVGALGVTVAPALVARIGLGPSFVTGGTIFGIGAAVVGMVDGWWAVAPFGIATAGVSINQVAFVTMRQRLTPTDMMGRVIAASRTLSWVGIPVGAALGGVLGETLGLRPLFIGGGVVIAAAAVALVISPLWRVGSAQRAPA